MSKLKNRHSGWFYKRCDPVLFFLPDTNDFKTQILDRNVPLGINQWWQLTSNRNDIAARIAIQFSMLGLKTLIFVDDPRIANSTSRTIAESLKRRINNYEEYINQNKDIISSIGLELGEIEHSYFYECRNVGVHHGLLLPQERTLIENYFKSANGSIALVATTTLAQGINLPAEMVIIAGDDRFDEDEENRQRVKPHELLNAAGRAGRAGLSSQGAVILIPGEIITIQDSTISNRWWQLKNEVFSKGDQCLTIKDPLEYILDSLQENINELSVEETNILCRFKPEKLSATDTKNLLSKSLYAFKASEAGNTEQFSAQVRRLLDIRNELDNLSEEQLWQKEIGIKTGLEPLIIYELDMAIELEGIKSITSKSILEIIDWFFEWLISNDSFIEKIFTKQSTIAQIKKAVGLKPETTTTEIIPKLNLLANILKVYVHGQPLNELNANIPDVNRADNTGYLIKARNFVTRLVPELSFGFGLVTMIIIEKAQQVGINKQDLPLDIRVLASCIREGFDSSAKLFHKKNNQLLMRVETHLNFNQKNCL